MSFTTARRSTRIAAATGAVIALIAAGSLAHAQEGNVVAWGDDTYLVVERFPIDRGDAVQVANHWTNALVLYADGTVAGSAGQIPANPQGDRRTAHVEIPPGLDGVVQVAAGDEHAQFLRADGTVVATGLTRPLSPQDQAYQIPAATQDVLQLSTAGGTTLALHADGTVSGWGSHNPECLIVRKCQTTEDHSYSLLDFAQSLRDVVQVAAGNYHGIALHRDGSVTIWAHPLRLDEVLPAGEVGTAVSVAVGHTDTIVILADGSTLEWAFGVERMRGTPGSGASPMVSVSISQSIRLGITGDGRVEAWPPINAHPVFTEPLRAVPEGLANVSHVAASNIHAFAVVDPAGPRLAIVGELAEGSTVNAELSNWRGSAGEVTYQWYSGGAEVPGVTGPSYTITENDIGGRLLVRALSTVPGAHLILSEALDVTPPVAAPDPGSVAEAAGGPWLLVVIVLAVLALTILLVLLLLRRRHASDAPDTP